MNIQLQRPIVFLDLETTGLNLVTDRVVEIAMLKVQPDGTRQMKRKLPSWRLATINLCKTYKIIDEAIQVFGATGISQWTPLARLYAGQRTLRLADGPDEVHWHVVGRAELARYEGDNQPTTTYERGGMFSGPAWQPALKGA